MTPKTRSKTSKSSKENIGVSSKSKIKATNKVTKPHRKALADKTNSASDDNASFLQLENSVKVNNKDNFLIKQRPRRERRLPSRYVQNEVQNLSTSKNEAVENVDKSKPSSIKCIPVVVLSPLKIPKIKLDSSLIASRPKRICRLPSKFDNHSVSLSKYSPLQPVYASTPNVLNKPKQIGKKYLNKKGTPKKSCTEKIISTKANKKRNVNKKIKDTSDTNSPNSSADTNNNPKTYQLPHIETKNQQDTSFKVSINNPKYIVSKKLEKNLSIRILEDTRKSLKRDASNVDIYEFTYDPNEEPPPQKKKRKKPTKKREPKPKLVVYKDNYDKNLAKALINLKHTISDKSTKPIAKDKNVKAATKTCTAHPVSHTVVTTINTQPIPTNSCNFDKSHTLMKNYNSVRVEDIALDLEQDCGVDDVNYSPVHAVSTSNTPIIENDTPSRTTPPLNNVSSHTPLAQKNMFNIDKTATKDDPLNLREDLSFFDDQPVASSSMNVSTRNPAASPWRVEFENLPIKWQVNTYVKPNMTPAFESSFMNFNDSKKKHVYTNLLPETNEENDLPHIYEDYASKLKQTSIISFIKEVVEKNAKKKKEKMTPIKSNSLSEDLNNTAVDGGLLTQNNHITPKKNTQTNVESHDQSNPSRVGNISNENEVFLETPKENGKQSSKENVKSSSKKKQDDNVTYFGFDDSENHDQENVSPVKKIDKRKLRALKPRARAILQEINEQKGPTRAMPVAVKSKPIQSSETANKLFDHMKSTTEQPVSQVEDPVQNTEATITTNAQNNLDTDDDQSVHLFEDIEVVHHLKAHRKSYGKAKKVVTYRQNSISDSDVPPSDVAEQSASSEEDDLLDLTFKVPAIEPKKMTKKKKSKKTKISKKEEQEVEAWAAGFNSMCEDIEDFNLVVE